MIAVGGDLRIQATGSGGQNLDWSGPMVSAIVRRAHEDGPLDNFPDRVTSPYRIESACAGIASEGGRSSGLSENRSHMPRRASVRRDEDPWPPRCGNQSSIRKNNGINTT